MSPRPQIGRLDAALYAYRRSRWMLRLPSLFLRRRDPDRKVDRPIFLLGVQGGGLTLVSRMLRRHPRVVSVTGNHRYWAGADELQNVLGPVLPAELTGIVHKVPPDDVFTATRSWVYASDRLLPKYRRTAADATRVRRGEFRRLLHWLVAQHAHDASVARFTDKSQVFTVRASYINALLDGCGARFLLITRDPYAACARGVRLGDFRPLLGTHSAESRLDIAAQCWVNSMRCALEDGQAIEHFKAVRFEDILADPTGRAQEICAFTGLDYSDDLVPQPQQSLPRGSRMKDRWYPLRTDVNERHRSDLDEKSVAIIETRCGGIARQLGYEPPP